MVSSLDFKQRLNGVRRSHSALAMLASVLAAFAMCHPGDAHGWTHADARSGVSGQQARPLGGVTNAVRRGTDAVRRQWGAVTMRARALLRRQPRVAVARPPTGTPAAAGPAAATASDVTAEVRPAGVLVAVQSNFSGEDRAARVYARATMHHALLRGESPMSTRLLYDQPGVLDFKVRAEAATGVRAGRVWTGRADKLVVYTDLGVSPEMRAEIQIARGANRPVEYRKLPPGVLSRLRLAGKAIATRGPSAVGTRDALAVPRPTPVILESPFAGPDAAALANNETYTRASMRAALHAGMAPFASHALYTQPGVLDDTVPEERRLGIDAGLAWGRLAEKTVIARQLGVSRGMQYGIDRAAAEGRPTVDQSLPAAELARLGLTPVSN